jgi:hypothetical protein
MKGGMKDERNQFGTNVFYPFFIFCLCPAVFSTSVNSLGVCLSTPLWNIIDPPAAVILNR